MSGAIYALASGSVVQELRLAVLSNNLANAGTAGFKMDTVSVRLPENTAPATGPSGSGGASSLSGLIPVTEQVDFAQGPHQTTGNPLDLALEGEGFFCVSTEAGVRYTRNGSFTLSPEGLLTTRDGDPVLGNGGEIAIDGSSVTVDRNGNVFADGNAAGTLRVVKFDNPQSLAKAGGTLFVTAGPEAVEVEVEAPVVQQGALEGSNVNAVKMMTDMIEVLRGYESYQKVIRTIDESTSRAIASVGSPE
ncbi:MAG: flagellar basal-body rod protein FlgF [Desulfobacterales bacterium]